MEKEEVDAGSVLDDLRALGVDEMIVLEIEKEDVKQAQRQLHTSVTNLMRRYAGKFRVCNEGLKSYVIRTA